MKRLTTALILQATLLIALFAPCALAQNGNRQPPVAKKVPHETRIHGYTLKDDYFWLREKKNPEVIKYLEDENAYTEEVMKPTKEFQEALYKEILGHIKQTDLSVPSRIGEFYYYSRTEEGKQYPYQCRKKGSLEAKEEILLDLNKLAEGHSFLGVGRIPRQRRQQSVGLLDRHDRLSSTYASRQRPAHRANIEREHRTHRLDRVGE